MLTPNIAVGGWGRACRIALRKTNFPLVG